VNLSDLAAMGAEPRYALLSLALPASLPLPDFDAILDGLLNEAARHHVAIAGGNISSSPGPLVIDVTAVGTVRPRRCMRRDGARPGDVVFVSGAIGAARAGLELRRMAADDSGTDSASLSLRYLRPEARVRLGLQLARRQAATACIDLSDGLADGCGSSPARLARASRSTRARCRSIPPRGSGSSGRVRIRPPPPSRAATTTSCCSPCRRSGSDACAASSVSCAGCRSRASAR